MPFVATSQPPLSSLSSETSVTTVFNSRKPKFSHWAAKLRSAPPTSLSVGTRQRFGCGPSSRRSVPLCFQLSRSPDWRSTFQRWLPARSSRVLASPRVSMVAAAVVEASCHCPTRIGSCSQASSWPVLAQRVSEARVRENSSQYSFPGSSSTPERGTVSCLLWRGPTE